MIEYFIQLMDLDPDEEQRLRHKLRPLQRRLDTGKVVLAWCFALVGAAIGFSSCIYYANEHDAQMLEERHQTREHKCQVWAKTHNINVKWNRDMWLCMGSQKDGSVYSVVLTSGILKKLKGRD